MAQSKKNPCPFCGRSYVNLGRHLVCPARDQAQKDRAKALEEAKALEASMKATKSRGKAAVLKAAHYWTAKDYGRTPGVRLVTTPELDQEFRARLASQAQEKDIVFSSKVKEARAEYEERAAGQDGRLEVVMSIGIKKVMEEWKSLLLHLGHASCDDEVFIVRCRIEEVQARAEAYGKALRKKIVPPQITGRDRAEFAQARKALPWYEMKA
jgi:hypothetical protein